MAMVLMLRSTDQVYGEHRARAVARNNTSMSEEESHQTRANKPRKGKNGEKKIPQRGLGVAQLEKLRIEEQQKQCLASSVQRYNNIAPLENHHQPLVFIRNYNYNLQQQQMKSAAAPPNSLCPTPAPLLNANPAAFPHASAEAACFPHIPTRASRDPIMLSLAGMSSMNPKPRAQLLQGLGQPHHHGVDQNALLATPTDYSPPRNSSMGRSTKPVESCVTTGGVSSESALWPGQAANCKPKDSFQLLPEGLPSQDTEIFGGPLKQGLNLMRVFEPSLWPPGPPPTDLPLMSISSLGVVQTEPPSNQSYPAHPAWPEEDTQIPCRKRLWPFSQENLGSPIQSKSTRMELSSLDAVGAFRNTVATSLEPGPMKIPWQASSEMASPCSKYPSDLSFSCESGHTPVKLSAAHAAVKDSSSSTSCMQPGLQLNWKGSQENDISSSQENETRSGFLTLGLPSSENDYFHAKPKEHSATSEGSDECGASANLQKETSADLRSRTMYPLCGLLKHGSISTADDGCSMPFYKFLYYESGDKGIADCMCQDNNKKPVDLDLRLSL